jgi:uncharacterized protein
VLLSKGEAHAASRGTDPAALLKAQLADGMYGLAVQAHWADEGAKLALNRLLGVDAPARADEGTTFAELHDRLDATLAYIGTVDARALEAGLARTIELSHRGGSKTFRGDRFLTEFAIPSFFFHLTTAYAILRHEGVPLQKGDFLGA